MFILDRIFAAHLQFGEAEFDEAIMHLQLMF